MVGVAQIGLVRTRGFSAWLIRAVTRSKFNHVVTCVSPTEVVSAEPSGVQVLPIEYFPTAVWSDFELTLQQQAKVINFTRAQLGKPYGYLTYFWIGIVLLFRVKQTPAWLFRRLNDRSSWVCSQLADSGFQAAGIHLFSDERVTGAVFPGSFEPIWREHGWIK